jgi:hypothetical protein
LIKLKLNNNISKFNKMKNLKIILLILITLIIKHQTTTLGSFPEQKLVNSDSTTGNQVHCTINKLSNSGFVVVWYDAETLTHKMQLYNDIGDKIGRNISIISNCSSYKNFVTDLGNNQFAFACVESSTAKLILYDYNGNVLSGPINVAATLAYTRNFNMTKIDNGNLVFVWIPSTYEIYFIIVTITGNIIANGFVPYVGTIRTSLVLESFVNNSFIICYKESVNTTPNFTDNVYCLVYNSLGNLALPLIIVETYTAGGFCGYQALGIKRLANDYIALFYSNQLPGTVIQTYLWVCDGNGTPVYGPTEVNHCTSGCQDRAHPRITQLTNGNLMLVYDNVGCCGGIQIYRQEINTSFQEVGNSVIVNAPYNSVSTNSISNTFPDIAALDRSGFAVVFYSINLVSGGSVNDIFLQIYYAEDISLTCKDITINVKTSLTYSLGNDFKTNISYQYMTDMKVSYLTNPNSGSFQIPDGSAIAANTATVIASYNYKSPDVQDSFIVQYVAVNHLSNQSSTCNLNINVCYRSCETCSVVGTDANNNCTSCKSGFLSLQSNCYCPEQLNGVYFYTSVGACNQCVSPCLTCTDAISCKTCASGYYLVENLTSNNCVQTCPSGYYLMGNICKQCNALCSICFDNPDNCPKCSSSAYYLNPNQCFSVCPSGYVPNDSSECVTCKSLNKYFYIDQCVVTCPKGIKDEVKKLCNDTEIVIECKNLILILAITCKPDSCSNQGQCEVQFNQIKCTCITGFIGSSCQIKIDSFNASEFVSNLFLTPDNISTINSLSSTQSIQALNDLYSIVKSTNMTETVGNTALQTMTNKVYNLVSNIVTYTRWPKYINNRR